MSAKFRRYKFLADFDKVNKYLADVYNMETLNSYLLPQYFEYAHTHPLFNHKLAHRIGLWEDVNELVGIACFDMYPGECFISVKNGCNSLLPDMINYSEENLSEKNNEKTSLAISIVDKEIEKKELLEKTGYTRVSSEPVTVFSYENPFPNQILPEGFSVISLEDENDFYKINDCLWYGFDHGPEPDLDNDIDCRILMQSGPNFRKDLTTVIKAPNGEYVCYAGMWFDKQNGYAYLEPLATVPKYRRMGLATVALVEGMKKTKELGAKYCFGGTGDFYGNCIPRIMEKRVVILFIIFHYKEVSL
jgi:hypothetical protein